MPQTQIIEPIKKLLKIDDDEKHNVCAYCRVSTDETDQKNSLTSQKIFFSRYFEKRINWNNVGIFADEGISGTSLEKRNEFNRMISLAHKRKIDIILTKEVSRFSRNVRDLLNVVEDLRKKEIYIWFLSDDINTESSDYRERLVEAATAAEKESLRTSRRVKWGQMQQMQRGVVFGRREMFGYNITKNQQGIQSFEIIPEEAEVIKDIFKWFSEGDGTHIIARRLEAKGIKTKRFKNGWSNTVILRILRNEKYVGDLAQGKTYTPDPLTHKKKYNTGEAQMVYITDHHPESSIIPRELWNKVQAILKDNEPDGEIKVKYSNRYWTSGKIFCGCCKSRYISYNKKQKNSNYKAWICFENHQRGQEKEVINELGEVYKTGCNNKRVNDRVLKIALKDIITEIISQNKYELCREVSRAIYNLDPRQDNSAQIKILEKKLDSLKNELKVLTEKLISGIVSDNIYLALKEDKESKIADIRNKISILKNSNNYEISKNALQSKYEQLTKLLSTPDDEIGEELFARITKKIVVYPGNILEIHLSFMLRPIYLRYKTVGRGKDYNAIFDVFSEEEIRTVLQKR